MFPVERVCANIDLQQLLFEALEEHGLLIIGAKGTTIAHPALREFRHLDQAIGSTLASLGFDPVSRARLGLTVARTASKLDEFLSRRREGLA